MSTISRRAFLKTVGVGALSVAAMSVLAGCEGLPTGTTPETPVVSGAVEAAVNTDYLVGDFGFVKIASEPAFATLSNWDNDYLTELKSIYGSSSAGKTAYEKDSEANREKAEAAATAAANGKVAFDKRMLTVEVTLTNVTEDVVKLATSAPAASEPTGDFKSNTNVFTATCDGKAVACAIDVVEANDKDTDDGETTVTCYINAAANPEKVVLKVAIPGATKVLEYTFKNTTEHKKGEDVSLSSWA